MGHRPSYATYLGGCRCDGCRAAAIDAYKVKRKKDVESRTLAERTRTAHGTEKSYNLGCRCERCEIAQEVRQEVTRRRTEQLQREEWVNRLTFAENTDAIEEEEELTDEELQAAVAEQRPSEGSSDFDFSNLEG